MFLFSFISTYFWCPLWYRQWSFGYLVAYFLASMYLCFLQFFVFVFVFCLWLISNIIALWLKKMLDSFNLLRLIQVWSVTQDTIYPGDYSMYTWRVCTMTLWDQFSSSAVSDFLWPHGLQHARLPCPSPTPRVYSNSRSLSWWCHPTISCSVIPFSSHLQSFPASGSFLVSQFFISGGQSVGVSTSA